MSVAVSAIAEMVESHTLQVARDSNFRSLGSSIQSVITHRTRPSPPPKNKDKNKDSYADRNCGEFDN
jgi:hypothetical protein